LNSVTTSIEREVSIDQPTRPAATASAIPVVGFTTPTAAAYHQHLDIAASRDIETGGYDAREYVRDPVCAVRVGIVRHRPARGPRRLRRRRKRDEQEEREDCRLKIEN
jgi:hypothetical protein